MSSLLEYYALSEYFLKLRISELRAARVEDLCNAKILEIEKLEQEIKHIAVNKDFASNLSTELDIKY